MAVVEVRNLVKHYGSVEAVRGVSFKVTEGVCFGLLGPNGAGKTTTIEIMEGIARPTSGEILYRGSPLGRSFREKVGIQFQATALQDYLTVREVLELFASFYNARADIDELIRLCALEEYLDRDNRKLSGGQRQRMLLAVALVNDPDIVFLDEPTTGLDPQARRNFWELVRTIKKRGKTILITTHYMEEAYELCDEIAIMDRGQIIAHGAPNTLLKEHFDTVSIEIPERDFPKDSSIPHETREGRVQIQTKNVNDTIRSLLNANVSLSHVTVRPQTLEDLFLKLTGKNIRA